MPQTGKWYFKYIKYIKHFRISKKYFQVNNKKTFKRNRSKDLKRHLSREDIKMDIKQIKRFSISLAIRKKIQIKIMRYHFTIPMAKIKNHYKILVKI